MPTGTGAAEVSRHLRAEDHLLALDGPHPTFARTLDDLSQVTRASQAVEELSILRGYAAPPKARAYEGGTRRTPRIERRPSSRTPRATKTAELTTEPPIRTFS